MNRKPAAQGRRDANQAEIVARYEALFCNVIDLSHVGFGCPDLLIACSSRAELTECKTTDGTFTPAQVTFRKTWRGPKIVIGGHTPLLYVMFGLCARRGRCV